MNWDEYGMSIAEVIAKKSKDPWRKVGVVILREDNSIASVGYNGFPQGVEEDWSNREERSKFVIHAEQNALRYTHPGEGKILISTTLPCRDCLKAIAAYKIKRVVYKDIYHTDPIALEIAEKMGVTLTQFKKEPLNMTKKFTEEQANQNEGWYVNAEEYDKLAAASKKLLSAINNLPIGSFYLLEKEYQNLKKALH